jgi:hypothetical protein
MRTHILLLFAFGLLLASCKSSTSSESPYLIDLETGITNISSVPLSSIGNKLEYIPLETDTACLIQTITNAFLTDSFIFVSDYDKLLKFDNRGNFLKQIGTKGRGPGEYPSLGNFLVDEVNKEIFVLSERIVLVFDFEGNFKRDFNIDSPCRQFILNKDKELIFHPFNIANPGIDTAYSWFITDRTGVIRTKLVNTLKRINNALIVPVSPLYLYDETPHLMEFGVDTLYNYVSNEKIPYAIFNPGKLKFPPDPTMAEVPEINGKIWINEIRETRKLFFVNLWWDLSDSISNCIYDKSSKSFSILKNGAFDNDIDGGLAFWPKKVINETLFLDYADAFKLIKFAKKAHPNINEQSTPFFDVVKHLSETSNPVLIILKSK